jgi:hypothetical protein
MVTGMNLREVVREVVDEATTIDLDEIATAVMDRIGAEDLESALAQTMRSFIREVMHAQRSPEPAFKQPFTQSWRVTGIREAANKRRLRAPYHVGGGKWKRLQDMTYDDLIAAAEERRTIAKRNMKTADLLDTWAAMLVMNGAPTFGELKPDIIEQAFEMAA